MNERESKLTASVVGAMISRLREADQLTSRSVPPGPHRLPALDRVIPAIHRRVRRAARAVDKLLQDDYSVEAAIVARSLFEDSLKLGALELAGDTRTALILGWLRESTSQAERVLRVGAEVSKSDLEEIKDAVKVRHRHLDRLTHQLGVTGKINGFPDEATMARAQSRLSELHQYLYASQLIHGSETGYFFDPDPVGDLSQVDFLPQSLEIVGVALSLSVTPLLRAHLSTARMLKWPGADEAQAILDAPLPGT